MAPTARGGIHHVGKKRQQSRSPIQARGNLFDGSIPARQEALDEYSISYHHPQPLDQPYPSKKFKSDISVQTQSPREFESRASPALNIGHGNPSSAVDHPSGPYSSLWHPVASNLSPAGDPGDLSHTGDYRTDFAPTYTSHPVPFSNPSTPLSQAHSHGGTHSHLPHSRHPSDTGQYHPHHPHSALPNNPIPGQGTFQSPTSVPAFSGIAAHPEPNTDGHSHQSGQPFGFSEGPHYSPVEAYPYHHGGTDLSVHGPDSPSHLWSLGISQPVAHCPPPPEGHQSSAGPVITSEYYPPQHRNPHVPHHEFHFNRDSIDFKHQPAYLGPDQVQHPPGFLVPRPPAAPQHPWVRMSDSEDERWRYVVSPGENFEERQRRELELQLRPRETFDRLSLQLRAPPIDPDSGGEEDDDGFVHVEVEGEPSTQEHPSQEPPSKEPRRKAFSPMKRAETSNTRTKGACVRCKIQKIRCDGEDKCSKCLQVGQNLNKKVIHHVPCKRWKMQDVVWSRDGGLKLTQRWQGTDVKDIPARAISRDIEPCHTVGIKIFFTDQGKGPNLGKTVESHLFHIPVEVEVHKFDPQEGDVLDRFWTKHVGGVPHQVPVRMKPYCLVKVERTRKVLEDYFYRYAPEAVEQRAKDENASPMVRDMFGLALEHWRSLPDDHQEKSLMRALFQLWFAMRFSTGSAFLDDSMGKDVLDMKAEKDEHAPSYGKISVPRMITAQIDSINAKYITKKLSKLVLAQLEAFYRGNNPGLWLTLFLSTFIFLHEVGHSTRDRWRHARQSNHAERYTHPLFVEDLHHGANIVLIHWQYYKSNISPASSGWRVDTRPRDKVEAELSEAKKSKTDDGAKKSKPSKPKVLLTPDQKETVEKWWADMKERNAEFPSMLSGGADKNQPCAWEDPMYYLLQMLHENWRPIDGYNRPG